MIARLNGALRSRTLGMFSLGSYLSTCAPCLLLSSLLLAPCCCMSWFLLLPSYLSPYTSSVLLDDRLAPLLLPLGPIPLLALPICLPISAQACLLNVFSLSMFLRFFLLCLPALPRPDHSTVFCWLGCVHTPSFYVLLSCFCVCLLADTSHVLAHVVQCTACFSAFLTLHASFCRPGLVHFLDSCQCSCLPPRVAHRSQSSVSGTSLLYTACLRLALYA
jgi:hypothetical protein